jgi:uncharacterized protein (TIGR02145 family)
MRYGFLFIPLMIFSYQGFTQSPDRISYQALVRNTSGSILANQSVGLRISILKGSILGTTLYSEAHSTKSNAQGIINIEIGLGTVLSGSIGSIYWGSDAYFIKTELDINGGSSYQLVNTVQILSVPYSLYASDVFSYRSFQGDTLVIGRKKYIIQGLTDVSMYPFPPNSMFCSSGQTEIVEVKNQITGRIWMDRNLGAKQIATSISDIHSMGDLYQWGRRSDGHQCRSSTIVNVLSSTDNPTNTSFIISNATPNDWRNPQNSNLWQGISGVNNPCPDGFRLPTESEWLQEVSTWTSNDATSAFQSTLKLPLVGYRNPSTGAIVSSGSIGNYWSSTTSGSQYVKYFAVGVNNLLTTTRASGHAVRCIKNQ